MEIRTVEFHRAAYKPEDFPHDQRPQFAMAGRSNVGKSSLINAVLNRKSVARVSHTPGKTQAVHFYLINNRFYLVDLPGYGYAKVSQDVKRSWATLVQGYLDESPDLRLMFLLLDSRRVPSDDDLRMHEWSVQSGVDERILLTKTDKLSNNELAKSRKAVATELDLDDSASMIACSAVTKKGIEEVRREIASRLR